MSASLICPHFSAAKIPAQELLPIPVSEVSVPSPGVSIWAALLRGKYGSKNPDKPFEEIDIC